MPRLRATETPPKRGLRRAADPLVVVVVARNCADRMMRRPLPIDRHSRFPFFFFWIDSTKACQDGGPAGQGRGLKRRGFE